VAYIEGADTLGQPGPRGKRAGRWPARSAVLARIVHHFLTCVLVAEIPEDVFHGAPSGRFRPIGALDAAIHASGKTTEKIISQLADLFGVGEATSDAID